MRLHEQGCLVYEVSVFRRPEAERVLDRSACGAVRAQTPEQTVISLRNADENQVHRLVDWLADLRLELASIRRCGGNPARGRGDTDLTRDGEPGASYEVGVFGRLGPALLSTLPHDAVRIVPAHTVLLLSGWDSVLRVLDALVAADIAVQSVCNPASVRRASGWRSA